MNDEQLQNEAPGSGDVPAVQAEVQPGMEAPVSAEAALIDLAAADPALIDPANIDAMDELFAELLSEQDASPFEASAIDAAAAEPVSAAGPAELLPPAPVDQAVEDLAPEQAAAVTEPETSFAPAVAVESEPEAATSVPDQSVEPVVEAPASVIAAPAAIPGVAEASEEPADETPQLECAPAAVEPEEPQLPDLPAETVAPELAAIPLETASLAVEPESLEIDEPAGLDWLEAAPEVSAEAAAPAVADSIEEPPPSPVDAAAPAESTEAAPAAEDPGFDAPDFMLEELLAAEQDFGATDHSETIAPARVDAPVQEFAPLAGSLPDGLEDEQPERSSPPLDDLIRGIDAQLEAVAPVAAPVEQPAVTHKQFSQLDDYVVFTLSGGDYALPVRDVAEIGRVPTVTKVPNVPEFVRGITNLRGEIVPVLNLPQLLGLQETAPTARGRVLFLQARDQVAASGLMVDEVKGIQRIPSQQLEHVTGLVDDKVTSVLRGVHGRGDRLLNVLDLEQVFRLEEFQKFERR